MIINSYSNTVIDPFIIDIETKNGIVRHKYYDTNCNVYLLGSTCLIGKLPNDIYR